MPGIQDKNSNPDNEFSSAKFETFLSNAEAPAIIAYSDQIKIDVRKIFQT